MSVKKLPNGTIQVRIDTPVPFVSLGPAVPYGPPTQIVVTANPVGVLINVPFSLTVNALDAASALVLSYGASATVTKASGPGTLSGTITASFSGGVLTFSNLLVNTVGT